MEFIEVKKISKKKYKGKVYNLEVEKANSYAVNGILVHNCALAPVLYTPEELGLMPDDISRENKAEWEKQEKDYPLYKDQFEKLTDREKLMIFGNQKLFDLYKSEKLPLEFFVSKKGTTISFKDATAKLYSQKQKR